MLALIPLGLRNGDGPRDVRVLAIDAVGGRRGASVTLTNPDRVPVIVGMSLRPAGLRLRLEGDAYVRIRTRSTAPDVLPRRQTAIAVLSPGATATFLVAADADVPQRAELVVRIGQRQRLRVIHRLVQLPPPDSAIDRQDLLLARR